MANFQFSKGQSGIVTYSTANHLKDDTTYLVQCDKSLLDYAISNFSSFITSKTPKFGKYEVEEVVAKMLLLSLIQGDITALLNTQISYDDSPYNSADYSADTIRKRILEYCEIINLNNGIMTLKYLGKKA